MRPHPARRRIVNPLTLRVGKRRRLVFERFTEAVFHGGRHPQTAGHHPQQGHDALGLVQSQRSGSTLRGVHTSAPALRVPLACAAVQRLSRRQWGGVECMGGQDDAPVLGEEGLPGRERGGPRPVDLVDHLGGARLGSGSTPLAIAGLGAHRAGAQNCGVHGLRAGRTRLTRLGLARAGRAREFLQGLACFGTLLAPRLGDGAARLRSAGLSVEEDPALRKPAVGRGSLGIARAGGAAWAGTG
jgi:hypothetical protein